MIDLLRLSNELFDAPDQVDIHNSLGQFDLVMANPQGAYRDVAGLCKVVQLLNL